MLRALITLIFLSFLVTGCSKSEEHSHGEGHSHAHGEHNCGPCEKGQAGGTIWCDSCKMGFIEGKTTTDKAAVDAALKAEKPAANCAGCSKAKADCDCHGHDHEKSACSCAAGKAGGTVWCDHCGSGYIKGEKSKDKAAVEAALKPAEPAAAATCSGCDKAKADCSCHGHDHDKGACSCAAGKAGGTTWCGHCGSGYIKGVKSKDKAAVEAALKTAQ
jgi:hypothetical protein